jgi:hypothetical protein
MAELVELRPMAPAFHDPHAELLFEQRNAGGHRRLRDALRRGGAGKRALLGNRAQEAEMSRVYFHSL